MNNSLWFDRFYLENFALVAAFLVVLGVPLFFMKKNQIHAQASWASVKSWLYILPLLFICFGFPYPGPLIFMCLISGYTLKRFYQMTGIYHKTLFVLLGYLAIAACGLFSFMQLDTLYFSTIFVFLFLVNILPILQNNPRNSIQYVSLTTIGFCLFGWNILFAGRVLDLNMGVYVLFYLYALAEFTVSTTHGMGLMISSPSIIPKITSKARITGLIFSFIFTMLVAWGFRRMLFNTSELYWVSAGLITFIGAHFGSWLISTYRKDLGIKDQGVFIIGRGDILSRTHHIIFVYPFYTLFLWFTGDLKFFN